MERFRASRDRDCANPNPFTWTGANEWKGCQLPALNTFGGDQAGGYNVANNTALPQTHIQGQYHNEIVATLERQLMDDLTARIDYTHRWLGSVIEDGYGDASLFKTSSPTPAQRCPRTRSMTPRTTQPRRRRRRINAAAAAAAAAPAKPGDASQASLAANAQGARRLPPRRRTYATLQTLAGTRPSPERTPTTRSRSQSTSASRRTGFCARLVHVLRASSATTRASTRTSRTTSRRTAITPTTRRTFTSTRAAACPTTTPTRARSTASTRTRSAPAR